jgi:hypothetical protein
MFRFLMLPLTAIVLPAADPAFIPDTFQPPAIYKTAKYQLVPLGPDLAKQDYDAYMSSIEHLRTTFGGGRWPNAGITMADARKDVEGEKARFVARRAFTYAVLTPDGSKELGCVYIRPSRKAGYDAQVSMWVTKAQYDKGFDAALFKDMKAWIVKEWPFARVAFPNRDIPAEKWEALPNK